MYVTHNCSHLKFTFSKKTACAGNISKNCSLFLKLDYALIIGVSLTDKPPKKWHLLILLCY